MAIRTRCFTARSCICSWQQLVSQHNWFCHTWSQWDEISQRQNAAQVFSKSFSCLFKEASSQGSASGWKTGCHTLGQGSTGHMSKIQTSPKNGPKSQQAKSLHLRVISSKGKATRKSRAHTWVRFTEPQIWSQSTILTCWFPHRLLPGLAFYLNLQIKPYCSQLLASDTATAHLQQPRNPALHLLSWSFALSLRPPEWRWSQRAEPHLLQ